MLSIKKFTDKIVMDLSESYKVVNMKYEALYIVNENSDVTIPIGGMYSNYKLSGDYGKVIQIYKRVIDGLLNRHEFVVDYSNIYPYIRKRNIIVGQNLNFYHQPFILDLDLLYVIDEGETFRFILNSDEVDFERIKVEAQKNINKLANTLEKINSSMEIYALKFNSEYNAAMLLNSYFQKMVQKKIGRDYLFTIPTTTNIILAKYNPYYIDIMKSLGLYDENPDKVSLGTIYRCRNGIYEFAEPERNLKVVK